jgi:hypothetical protein
MEVPMGTRHLTEAQAKALDDIEAHLEDAYADARERLAAVGIGGRETEPHFECLRCDCDSFTSPGMHGDGNCATPLCGHSFRSHNIPR